MFFDTRIGRNFVRVVVEKAIIVCHGLPYEAGSVIDKNYYELAKKIARRLPAVIFDFTGTGASRGDFSLLSWKEDILRLAEEFENVLLVGYSMGGCIALAAASELENVEKVAVVASPCCADTFSEESLREIHANAISRGLLRGVDSFEKFRDRFISEFLEIEPLKYLPKLTIPKLFVHGTDDNIVPFWNSEKMYSLAKKPKSFFIVENGNHFLRRREDVTEKILDWIEGKIEGELKI
ncbi:MAG: alpha/beta hydrolase [Archaeoglobaceae archaeon]